MTAEQAFAEEQSRLNGLLETGAISQETYDRAIAQATQTLEDATGVTKQKRDAEEAHAAMMREGAAVTKSVMTAEQKHERQLDTLKSLLKSGAISQDTFNRAVSQADDELKKAQTAANKTGASLDDLGRHAKKASHDLSVIKNIAIGAVAAKGISILANAFTTAGRAAVTYAAGVAESIDKLNDLSERIGVGVESLQVFNMAAKLAGVEDGTRALQKLSVEIGQAAESGNTEAFTRLGIDFEKLQAMSPEEQFRTIQAAIAALPTPAERAAAAVAMFGKAGVELLPLMTKDLKEIEERMKRLGAVVGADQVEAIGEMNDSLDMVRATFDGIIGQVVGNLAPIVTSMAEEFLAFVESFNSANSDSGGVAGVITNALLDVAEYMAGVFDTAVASFSGFGVTMAEVGEVFQFVGNVFTAVGETLRGVFNAFEVFGNLLMVGLGKLIEGIGSWVDEDMETLGRELAANASAAARRNEAEGNRAFGNAGRAASAAVFGESPTTGTPQGPAGRAVAAARDRMTPEAQAEREAARKAKDAEAKAAREAAAAQAKADKEAADAKRRQEEAARKAAAIDERMAGKQENIDAIEAEKAAALAGKSNESLKANDIRSSEGMAQFLALATGREDPAIEENRKTNAKLEEIRKELRALQQEKVDILGAAA